MGMTVAIQTKFNIYKTLIKLILIHGCEIRTLSQVDMIYWTILKEKYRRYSVQSKRKWEWKKYIMRNLFKLIITICLSCYSPVKIVTVYKNVPHISLWVDPVVFSIWLMTFKSFLRISDLKIWFTCRLLLHW